MKSFLRAGLFLLLALGWVATASARIRYVDSVPGDYHYPSISTAYTAAANGDTILVGEGSYAGIDCYKNLVFIGGGFNSRITSRMYFGPGSVASSLEGLRCTHLLFDGSVSPVVVKRCRVESHIERHTNTTGSTFIEDCIVQYAGVWLKNDLAEIRNTIFNCGHSDYSAISGSYSDLMVVNCSFVNFYGLLNIAGSNAAIFVNSIVYDWWNTNAIWGTYPTNTTFTYIAAPTGNPVPPANCQNLVLLSQSPFVNYNSSTNYQFGTSDMHLAPGSSCINAGSPAILDLDGSTSDLGVYGGMTPLIDTGAPSYPFVSQLAIPPAITAGQPLPVSSTGRIGREY